MQLGTTVLTDGTTTAVLIDPARGALFAGDLLDDDYPDAGEVLRAFPAEDLARKLDKVPEAAFHSPNGLTLAAPYRNPRMIWGIGLNYREHAADLAETAPAEEPASFIKGDHTVIGPGEPIPLPWQSERVTAEAELGLIIGRECRNVGETEALDYVWGVVPILDQTAEDILAKNPRYLTRSKNFPGFFSFGPAITPMQDVLDQFGDIGDVAVSTVRNGQVHRRNTVEQMMFGPANLVSFHSQVMPLYPGDIISTGTPGAVQIHPGDVAECRIDGIGTLSNPVTASARRQTDAT
ncbi:fumarylacetoacetate hydrolase family protein [Saxibacter everestensis]|uniref:Fumarylacetoacetate hydrolase family protein n=1 Tax=Saxibacter everestensis TaxID=2909229 RepID=A0ABY8QQI3_9MICO|nr:fumarylacetoacetate hydrolase family protein [Brevibacteriaceae bacterium ZFBP1038]